MTTAVNAAVHGLTAELHGKMTEWESKVQQQWVDFEQKLEDKIVQLEPGSVEGTVSLAEHRIRMNVQIEMDKTWSDRLEKENRIVLNKYETLNSTVGRLGREVVNLTERKMGSAASTMPTSSGGGTTGYGTPEGQKWVFAFSCGTEMMVSVE